VDSLFAGISKTQPSARPRTTWLRTLLSAGRSLYTFATSEAYRSGALIKLKKPPHLFQPFVHTEEDRHPLYFEYARTVINDGTGRRLLSFGCSSGEEVFSLRGYFPRAFIKGIDINPRNIAKCRRRLRASGDKNIAFAVDGTTFDEQSDSYDAIFCMSVFTHGELVTSRAERCDHLIRFADFECVVADLARCLKSGGMLFIAGSSFRFKDTAIYDAFEPVMQTDRPNPMRPVFDRTNRLLPGVTYDDVAFRKLR